MSDPYKILGCNETDSDQTIKAAYKELVKKYHPDKYSNSPVNELAEERMQEINAAFDEVMNMRRGGAKSSFSGDNRTDNVYYSSDDNYIEIRKKIQSGDVTAAEGMLDKIDTSYRGAEWYFLKGSVCYTRGWLNDAFDNFQKASSMEPQNQEYAAALSNMQKSRNGYMNGNPNGSPYKTTNQGSTGCNGCDMCQGLICADCCCECMGGDLIPCC